MQSIYLLPHFQECTRGRSLHPHCLKRFLLQVTSRSIPKPLHLMNLQVLMLFRLTVSSNLGWRVGWAIAPAYIASAMRNIHVRITDSAPAPFQEAALIALRSPPEFFESLRRVQFDWTESHIPSSVIYVPFMEYVVWRAGLRGKKRLHR